LLDLVHMSLESRLNVTSRLLALADLGLQTIRKLNVHGFPQPNSKKKGFFFITFPSLLVVAFFFRLPDFLSLLESCLIIALFRHLLIVIVHLTPLGHPYYFQCDQLLHTNWYFPTPSQRSKKRPPIEMK
jgi:hypothetical protein